MTTYTTIRLRFPDETTFLDTLEAAIPELYQPEVRDPETNEVTTPRGWLPSTVRVVRETLHVVRGWPEAPEVVRTLEGEVVGKRVAQLHVLGSGIQRQQRDVNGDPVTETQTVDGEQTEVPVMETLTGFHVDLRTSVAPETGEQTSALVTYQVTPTHPVRAYAGDTV